MFFIDSFKIYFPLLLLLLLLFLFIIVQKKLSHFRKYDYNGDTIKFILQWCIFKYVLKYYDET